MRSITSRWICRGGIKTAPVLCFALVWGVASAQDSFDNLSHVSHSTSLTFLKKDGHCDFGTVVDASASSVTASVNQGKRIIIPRNELLRVGDTDLPRDSIYSARSSWQDVTEVSPGYAETLRVVTKSGKIYRGKPVRISVNEIVLKSLAGPTTLHKRDIAIVEYLRQRPATDGQQYLNQEAPVLLAFSPDTWLRASTLSPKMTVILYDSSLAEDNAPMKCLRSSDTPVK